MEGGLGTVAPSLKAQIFLGTAMILLQRKQIYKDSYSATLSRPVSDHHTLAYNYVGTGAPAHAFFNAFQSFYGNEVRYDTSDSYTT